MAFRWDRRGQRAAFVDEVARIMVVLHLPKYERRARKLVDRVARASDLQLSGMARRTRERLVRDVVDRAKVLGG